MKNKHPERQPQKAISSGCSFQRYFSSSLLLVIHKRLVLTPASWHWAISPLDAFLMRQKPIYPPKRWIQMPCSLSLPQQIEQSVIKEKLLFAGFRKISSEVQKKFLHRTPVYGVWFYREKRGRMQMDTDRQRWPPRWHFMSKKGRFMQTSPQSAGKLVH